MFGMEQKSLTNNTVTIINGDLANGFKKDVLLDANAVLDEIKASKTVALYWEIIK